jgi:hypothetical protein
MKKVVRRVLRKINSRGRVAREDTFASQKITDLEIIYAKHKCSECLKTVLLAGGSRYNVFV